MSLCSELLHNEKIKLSFWKVLTGFFHMYEHLFNNNPPKIKKLEIIKSLKIGESFYFDC